jgi:hypothetical protein
MMNLTPHWKRKVVENRQIVERNLIIKQEQCDFVGHYEEIERSTIIEQEQWAFNGCYEEIERIMRKCYYRTCSHFIQRGYYERFYY